MSNQWEQVSQFEFDSTLAILKGKRCFSIYVVSCGTLIKVVTDSSELLEDVKNLNNIAGEHACPNLTLYFLAIGNDDAPIIFDETQMRFLCFGGMHYGRLKSLISSLGSFLRENTRRFGLHASAFQAFDEGFIVAAPPGAGKSLLLEKLKDVIQAVVTDDWCDLEIRDDYTCEVIQVDSNISFNEQDADATFSGNVVSKGRICKCGWRQKLFLDLEAFGRPTRKRIPIQHLFIVLPDDIAVRDIDAHTLARLLLRTSPHTPFSAPTSNCSIHVNERHEFFITLMKAIHNKNLKIEIICARNAQDTCNLLHERILSIGHKRIISLLLKEKSSLSKDLDEQALPSYRFVFPEVIVSTICWENRQLAKSIYAELLHAAIPMKALFIHGSTGKGYGQVAPNIDWQLTSGNSITMKTSVQPSCRDDLDIVCVCDENIDSYKETVHIILRKCVPSYIDVTLNLIGEKTLIDELQSCGTPALRRIILLNTPEVLYGQEDFSRFYDVALANFSSLDYAHEIDFRTLMRLSTILMNARMKDFTFSQGELLSILPTFYIAGRNGIHIGFPKKRLKMK